MDKQLQIIMKHLNGLDIKILESPVPVPGTASIMVDKTIYETLQRKIQKLQNKPKRDE